MTSKHSVNGFKRETTEDDCVLEIQASLRENTKSDEIQKENTTNDVTVEMKKALPGHVKGPQFVAYGYPGQNHVLPTTFVYFQQGGQSIPPGGGDPLHYTPDRNSFVRLVFMIVFMMLAATAGLNAIVLLCEDVSYYFKDHRLIWMISGSVILLGLNYAMACSGCTRVMPCNLICLLLAVIGATLVCIGVTVHYKTVTVMLAVAATTGVVFVCMLLACSRFDFTTWMLYVVVIAAAFGMISMVVYLYMLISGNQIPYVRIAILAVGTLISSIILVMELQMILGGRTVELSEDDYALGAFLLYMSIIDIFLKIVQMMGSEDLDMYDD